MSSKNSSEAAYDAKKKNNRLFSAVAINLAVIIVAIIVLIFAFSVTMLIVFIVALVLIDYYLYSSYRNGKRDVEVKHDDEFVSLITYLQIYITNGINVYQAFQMATSYLSSWMKEKVDYLLSQIDNDKTVTPFIDFATNFTLHHYDDILICLYQMVDQGNDGDFTQKFIYLFEKISEENRNANLERNKNSVAFISSLPLIGAAIYTICLTFGIINMIGDFVNVI